MEGTKKKLFTKDSVYLLGEPVHTLQKNKKVERIKRNNGQYR
jgi:hypothetical protein